jgi:anti-sigma regulatory factor (Ser/Thr protein kinase)
LTLKKSFQISETTIDETIQFVDEFCDSEQISMRDINKLDFIIEELVTNILSYSELAKSQEFSIELARDKDEVSIQFRDPGKPFDPYKDLAADDRELDVNDRAVGGLGWPLMFELCESVVYEREENENRLTLVRKVTTSS